MFLDDYVINIIVTERNRYADQILKDKSRSKNYWNPVSVDELWVFLGILIYQGIIIKPKQRWYWSNNQMIETPFVNNVMNVKRFETILKILHFSNNETFDVTTHPNPKI